MTQIEQVQIRELSQKIDVVLEVTTRTDERTKALKENQTELKATQEAQELRIRELENKPAKHWNTVVAAGISAIVGTGIGAWISSLIK